MTRRKQGSAAFVGERLEDRQLLTTSMQVLAFGAPQQIGLSNIAPSILSASASADLNDDGVLDVVLSGIDAMPEVMGDVAAGAVDPSFLRVFLSRANGTFDEGTELGKFAADSLLIVNSEDQFRIVAQSGEQISVWEVAGIGEIDGESQIEFGEQVALDLSESNVAGQLTDYVDLNGDGLPELVTQTADELALFTVDEAQFGDRFIELASYRVMEVDAGTDHAIDRFEVADIDDDGDLDLLMACRVDCEHVDHLMARLNDGEGNFDETLAIADLPTKGVSTLQVEALAAGVNYVVMISDSKEGMGELVQILAPVGDGTYAESDSIDLPNRVSAFGFEDINRDSIPDLLVQFVAIARRVSTPPITAVLLGDGMGQFLEPIPVPLSAAETILGSDASGALNTISSDAVLSRLSLVEATDFAQAFESRETTIDERAATIVDINQDGLLDVVGPSGNELQFLLGTKSGDFEQHAISFEALSNFLFYTGEFDGTPGNDLVVVGEAAADGLTHVIRIDTEGESPSIADTQIIDSSIVIEQGDLDADGMDDFVLRSHFQSSSQSSSVLLNRADGWVPQTLSTKSATVAIEDLDGDGTIEVYVFEDPIRIFKYADESFIEWGEVPKGTTRITVTDFNDDGLKDFLSIFRDSSNGTTLSPFVNNNDGTWQAWEPVASNSHALIDINGDGFLDIADVRRFYINNMDGTWTVSAEIESATPEWSERDSYIDVNGDGLVDVAKLHATTGMLTIHQLTPENTWLDIEPLPTPGFEYELVDLNSDGIADLVDYNLDRIVVTTRTETGWLGRQLLGENLTGFLTADQDSDGRLDIVSLRSDSIAWYLQDDSGSFVESEIVDTGPFTVTDVNGDDRADIQLTLQDSSIWRTQIAFMPGNESGFGETEFVNATESGVSSGVWSSSGLRVVTDESEVVLYASSLLGSVVDTSVYEHRMYDIDGDNDLDLLALHPDGLAVLYGIGAGDFNRDGQLNGADVDAIRTEMRQPEPDASLFDLNLDEVVNEDDVVYWLAEFAGTTLGDADLNGEVNFRDFLRFSQNFGRSEALWENGDFDGDQIISFPDFLILSRFFGDARIAGGDSEEAEVEVEIDAETETGDEQASEPTDLPGTEAVSETASRIRVE